MLIFLTINKKLILYQNYLIFNSIFFSKKHSIFIIFFPIFYIHLLFLFLMDIRFGSVNNEQIDNNNFDIVNAGLKILLIYLNKYHHFY